MPTRINPQTIVEQSFGPEGSLLPPLLAPPNIYFEVPVDERAMRDITDEPGDSDQEPEILASYTLTALGRLDDGSYTSCESCNRHPIRRYYLVANYIWVEDQEVVEATRLMCERCTNERVDSDLMLDQQRRIRAEGQTRRLAATRPASRAFQDIGAAAHAEACELCHHIHRADNLCQAPLNTATNGQIVLCGCDGEQLRNLTIGMDGNGILSYPPLDAGSDATPLVDLLDQSIQRLTASQADIAEAANAAGQSQAVLGAVMEEIGIEPTQCLAHDLPELPNGVYTYESHEGSVNVTYEFSIWTVRNSASNPELNGRRIIRRHDGTHWRGFAFLMSDGSLTTWRRFRNEIVTTWHSSAIEMLDRLATGWPIVQTETTHGVSIWRRGRSWRYDSERIMTDDGDISILMACRICNEPTNTQWTSGLCDQHYAERLSVSTTTTIGTGTTWTIAPLQGGHEIDLRLPARRRALALDELGHGEIL